MRNDTILTAWEARLRTLLPTLRLRRNVPLRDLTSLRIGGPAALLAEPQTEEELSTLLRFCAEAEILPALLGAGTNVLVPDQGPAAALVIRTRGLDDVSVTGAGTILAGCGASLAALALFALREGRTGLEFAHGIPGTVGGGLYMNAGAYGGELGQTVQSVRFLHPDGTVEEIPGGEAEFAYRSSRFARMNGVILSGEFSVPEGDPEAIRARMDELAQRRRSSQPLDLPSAGSAFKRPQTGYAAAMIEQAGLKGLRVGGAEVSTKHAGFIVNVDSATAEEVKELVRRVQEAVRDRFGVTLEPEIRFWP